MVDMEREFKAVMRDGKVVIGLKQTKKMIERRKAKMVVVARNCPEKEEIERMAKEKGIPVLMFSGKGIELGPLCGKPFAISAFAVLDEGRSSILKLAGGSTDG
ncbi:MAG TPA: 50S ribosomal protein L30e [Thermoplasmatales archaeon]|nr:50S ribosomal protein L30e [Thermoplasmatales archaeon]HEX16961.1 50S ribosomal protein L30e [Thermoplasmatales archaeon]